MDFKLGPINLNAVAQGVGGLVFGNENSTSNEDSYVERLLDRISNGVLADDRRAAMTELQAIVAESRDAQLAFGAMGFPVLMSVLKEERDDVEMVRGALETFVGALNPIEPTRVPKNDIQPDALNADLLSRESDSTAVLLSLLSEDDFYIRYYTLQLLTALLTKSPNRLQEAILAVPRGITQLMDMLMDREVIRNEALLLLTYLTREAEEIQKIVVFEGAFEKIFSIVKEEGGSEGGVVVQDCLELLNNLLRNNISNQVFLKETLGFDPLVSIFKLRKGSAYNFSQQKTVNLLSALSTIELLLNGGSKNESGKDANRLSNQIIFAQKKMMDYLLLLGVESKWAPLAIRSLALHCVGDLVVGHPQNLDILANKKIGDDPHFEPALNAILQTILRTSSVEEFMSAEYVLKCFCEKNTDGQTMLVSTITHQPYLLSDNTVDGDANMPFGRILLRGFIISETDGDIKMCSRAASVLYHLLKDNNQCKERLLQVELETPIQLLGSHEPLIHRILRYLSLASLQTKDNVQANKVSPGKSYIEPIILRSLITWLADCPNAVHRVLELPAHINYLIELISNPSSSVYVRGLASTLLGECVLYNRKSKEHSIDSFAIADSINQKIGLAVYFSRFEEMQKSILSLGGTLATNPRPLKRNSAANLMEIEVVETNGGDQEQEHPILKLMFDLQFVNFLKSLEIGIRESIVDIFSRPKNNVAIMPLELEQQDGERDADYIKRLKSFVEQQCFEMQELVSRNALLADGLAKTSEFDPSTIEPKIKTSQERVQSEYLSRDLQQATQRIEKLKMEKVKIESELSNYKNLALKFESDLKSLSDAYNSLEQVNVRLETEVKALRQGHVFQDLETIKAEAREEAQKESETELNDLLVCLGQEQSKVEKLSARLMDLGEDVDGLLEGIGDETGIPDDGSEEDED